MFELIKKKKVVKNQEGKDCTYWNFYLKGESGNYIPVRANSYKVNGVDHSNFDVLFALAKAEE